MRTAFYGVTCMIAGMVWGYCQWLVPVPPLWVVMISLGLGAAACVVGATLEALLVNQRLWGEDRYDR